MREALDADAGAIERLFVARGEGASDTLREITQIAERAGVSVETLPSSRELSALVKSDSHQSVAALLSRSPVSELADFLAATEGADEALLVALDEVSDPHNLGAILRAAECFGAAGVMWSRNRGCGFTPSAAKASVGAAMLVRMVEVSNLADALRRLKEKDFWIIAADAHEGAGELGTFEWPKRAVLVLGAEGEGLKRLTLERAELRVKIPLVGRIDSLNVSQAAAVLLAGYRGAMREGA